MGPFWPSPITFLYIKRELCCHIPLNHRLHPVRVLSVYEMMLNLVDKKRTSITYYQNLPSLMKIFF